MRPTEMRRGAEALGPMRSQISAQPLRRKDGALPLPPPHLTLQTDSQLVAQATQSEPPGTLPS